MRFGFGIAGVLAWFFLFGACSRITSSQDARTTTSQEQIAELRVTDDASHLLFTYLQADGSFVTVEKLTDIPQEARSRVIVTDTSLSPEERQSSRIIYVADLSSKREDGSYPCRPVSRFRFERDLLREPSAGALPEDCRSVESPGDRVILYATAWCSVCQAAEKFLRESGIPYQKKDVEADPAAQRELTCKAMRTRTRVEGVPVLDIAGQLLVGFDRDDILRLADKMKKDSQGI